ncbi:hypothetical protein [Spiroplasma endosymbiont of Nebria brevicollis]|uniref:hypothetical protein n=1 Tax=Spiroplasma endosymbiont of Nebria brevicollis TaxID=3066284 RepID=UPI00313E1A16
MNKKLKKIKFKEKKTWLIVFSIIFLITALYYLITLIYWDNYFGNLNISTDKTRIYFFNDRYFLIKIMIFMLVCSFTFIITWIILKIRKIETNILPQSN